MSLRTHGGHITLPPNRPIRTVESLHKHLESAMAVELSTIPLYLYAMYSVTPATSDAAKAVHGVVIEEMLHLALAGNTLTAVGGTPKLYDPKIIPAYPTPMLGRVPELTLHLRQMTKENLGTFIQLELPESAGGKPEPDLYQTLGQFYQAIEDGLTYLNGKDPNLFKTASINAQFPPDSIYTPRVADAGGLVTVTDLPSALQALTIIVDQGEGKPGPGRPFDDDQKLEKDHYDIFLDLQGGAATWAVLPVLTDPTTPGYLGEDPKIYAVSLTFDAAYCYLLLTLQKLWTVSSPASRDKLSSNIFPIMIGILGPLARFLTQQQIGSAGQVAAPTFGFFEYKSPQELSQLKGAISLAIIAYVGNTGAQAALISVQGTINGLVDINSV